MVNANYVYTESDESREAREAYNRRSLSPSAHPDEDDRIEFPCTAGIVLVDLNELNKQDNGSGAPLRRSSFAAVMEPRGVRSRQLSLSEQWLADTVTAQSRPKLGFAQVARLVAVPLRLARAAAGGDDEPGIFGRKWRRRSTGDAARSEGGEASAASASAQERERVASMGGASKAADDEVIALELLQYVIEPKQGAEEAKSSATRSAQMRESYVTQELQVRQMWRVEMGNAPGLKAEIAKLHATERAKLALREFELGEKRRRSSSHLASSSTSPPPPDVPANGAGPSSATGAANGHQHPGLPPEPDSPQLTARAEPTGGVDSPAPGADGSDTHTPATSARTPGGFPSGGLFGWLTGSTGRKGSGSGGRYEATPDAGENGRSLLA